MKIYTKTGDNRETSLYNGSRVKKDNVVINACGDIDEVNSILGLVVSFEPKEEVVVILRDIQKTLFILGGDISAGDTNNIKKILLEDILKLESWIDEINNELPELKEFIMPGGTKASAFLHQARVVTRRAEREIVKIENVSDEILKFMNRLSDLLFVLARFENN